MAEQKTKTILFAGRDLDLNEFIRKAQSKVTEWMDYLGLQGDERTDFMNTLSNTLLGLVTGYYSTSDFGKVYGEEDKENQYKQRNGKRLKENSITLGRRRGFNPTESVEIYLNGIAGAIKEPSTKSTLNDNKPKKKRSANSMAQYIYNSIFGDNPITSSNGEMPEWAKNQLKLWADHYDKYDNGARSTEGRKKFINDQLESYKNSLYESDLSPEEIEEEVDIINKIQSGTLPDWELNKLAPWLSNLLFTDENYFLTPELKKVYDEENLRKLIENYVKNGGENPFNEKDQKDLYDEVEKERKEYLKNLSFNDFGNYSIKSNSLRGEHYLPKYDIITDGNIFLGYDYNDVNNGWQAMLNALYSVNKDYSAELGLGTDLAGGPLGIGGDNPIPDETFNGIIPDRYIREVVAPSAWVKGRTTKGSRMYRSANAYRAKFLSDYLNYYIDLDPDKFRIKKEKSEFILPSMIDWETGTAYLITRGQNQKGSIRQINIADLLPTIKENNPSLYNELYQYYLNSKNISFDKKGGKLKYQFGGGITYSDGNDVDKLREYIESIGLDNFNRELYKNQKIGGETNLSAADKARIGAIAADLVSAVSAFVPVYGTAVSAVTGLGSTVTNLGADWSDPAISKGETLKNVGINLGLDLVSLIPGVGMPAVAAKVVKPIAKFAPKILMLGTAAGVAPEFIDTVKKIQEGNERLTVNDLRVLAQGMSLISGGARITGSTIKNKKYRNKLYGDLFDVKYKVNDEIKTTSLTKLDIKDVNSAKTKEDALKIFLEKVSKKTKESKEDIKFTDDIKYGERFPWRNNPLKADSDNRTINNEALENFYKENQQLAEKPLGKILKTDFEMAGIIPGIKRTPRFGITHPFIKRGTSQNSSKTSESVNPEPTLALPQRTIIALPQRTITRSTVNNSESTPISGGSILQEKSALALPSGARNVLQIASSQKEPTLALPSGEPTLALPSGERVLALPPGTKRIPEIVESVRKNLEFIANTDAQIKDFDSQTLSLKNLESQIAEIKATVEKGPKRTSDIKKLLSKIRRIKKLINDLNDRILQVLLLRELARENSEIGKKQLKFYKDNLDKTIYDLRLKEYYRYLMSSIYGLKHGGILKANIGMKVRTSEQPKTPQPPLTTSLTSPLSLISSSPLTSTPRSGYLGEARSGYLGEEDNPNNEIPIHENILPYVNKNVDFNKTDLTNNFIRGLLSTTRRLTNMGVFMLGLNTPVFHETPFMEHYRQWSSKPIEDQIAKTREHYNNLGNKVASSYADSQLGTATQLAYARAGNKDINELTVALSEFTRNNVDKENEVANRNALRRHEVGEKNRYADYLKVVLDNLLRARFLNRMGMDNITDLDNVYDALNIRNQYNRERDYQAYIMSDPKVLLLLTEVDQLRERKYKGEELWTDADETKLTNAENLLALYKKQANLRYFFANNGSTGTGAPQGWSYDIHTMSFI